MTALTDESIHEIYRSACAGDKPSPILGFGRAVELASRLDQAESMIGYVKTWRDDCNSDRLYDKARMLDEVTDRLMSFREALREVEL